MTGEVQGEEGREEKRGRKGRATCDVWAPGGWGSVRHGQLGPWGFGLRPRPREVSDLKCFTGAALCRQVQPEGESWEVVSDGGHFTGETNQREEDKRSGMEPTQGNKHTLGPGSQKADDQAAWGRAVGAMVRAEVAEG